QAQAAANAPVHLAAYELAEECWNYASALCINSEILMAKPQPYDLEQARRLYASINDYAQHWSRHARSHNSTWLYLTKYE
ncbi:hypothetical protein AAGG60_21050, partial [Stenotrophomonas maltophilia]